MRGGGGVTGLDKLRATGTSTTGSSEEEEEEYSRQIGWGEDETGRGVVYRGRAGGEADGEGGSAEGSRVSKSMEVR
jgi:hypothetical protein